ncbi:hypothetical protein PO909_029644 [Leuciscus waleckii]
MLPLAGAAECRQDTSSISHRGFLSPPPASVPPAPPQFVDTSAPTWFLPPSVSTETIGNTASLGSLVHPAPPRSAVNLPAPLVQSGSAFPPAPPPSSGYPAPPWWLVTVAPPLSPLPSSARGLIGSIRVSINGCISVGRPQGVVCPKVDSTIAPPPWGLVLAGLWYSSGSSCSWHLTGFSHHPTPPWTFFFFSLLHALL